MWRTFLLAGFGVAFAVLAASCTGGGDERTRTVLVDYNHDEFAGSFLYYFPRNVTVHPGDEVEFEQQWTGEPHSVTMGTLVNRMMGVVGPLIEQYGGSEEEPPPKVMQQFEAAIAKLPWMIGEDSRVQQNAAQPCYLDTGTPPQDPATPCPKRQQEQPEFTGRHSYYNSGFIPYLGPKGNRFRVKLADDIAPGTYHYYCNLHGPFQSGTLTVVAADRPIPSQREVARQARREIEEKARPLVEAYERAKAGNTDLRGQRFRPPLAGWAGRPEIHAFISEFVPRRIDARVGQPVTWSFVGGHTVSFNVPEYFAQFTIESDGTVVFNPDAHRPVNSPQPPEPPDEEPPPPEAGGTPPDEEPPAPAIDKGRWDGRGFVSSGVQDEGTYRVTFTRPGSYEYACLIHPRMVGTVVVR